MVVAQTAVAQARARAGVWQLAFSGASAMPRATSSTYLCAHGWQAAWHGWHWCVCPCMHGKGWMVKRAAEGFGEP